VRDPIGTGGPLVRAKRRLRRAREEPARDGSVAGAQARSVTYAEEEG
jgi:hypothetical protein